MRAGLHAIIRDGAGWASPQTMVARADLAPALSTLAIHVQASAPTIHQLQDAATALSTDPAVRAWSRPLARAALEAGAPQTRQLLEDFVTNHLVPVRLEPLGPVMTAATDLAASHDRLAARFEGVSFDTRTAGLTPNSVHLNRLVDRLLAAAKQPNGNSGFWLPASRKELSPDR